MKWTEAAVIDALRDTYLPPRSTLSTEEWAFLTQVPLRCPRPGYPADTPTYWGTNERTVDVLLVRNWSGGKHGHERLAIEVKVSRSDYRNETDIKRAPAEAAAHRCAYAAPTGLIDPATLPHGWGLIEVERLPDATGQPTAQYRATWRTRAARRTPTANLDYLVSAGFRRASRAEERIRRGESAAAEIVALRAEVESLRGIADRATEARDREMARAKAARNELLALTGAQECSHCGEPLTWKRGGAHDSRWTHKDRSQEGRCYDQRYTAYRIAQAAGEPADYPTTYPQPAAAVLAATGT